MFDTGYVIGSAARQSSVLIGQASGLLRLVRNDGKNGKGVAHAYGDRPWLPVQQTILSRSAACLRSGRRLERAMTKLWHGVLMMCALLLAAPAWSADNDYRMGTGDVLRITVYGQPDLTT